MNDRSLKPVAAETGDTGSQSGINADLDNPSQETTGRELIVVDSDETSVGWFTRFMIRLGFRSNRSLR